MRSNGDTRILIAEDDFALANVVRFNLEQAGYRVCWAKNGQEALRELTSASSVEPAGGAFDLLITDKQMPTMCGVQLCQQVRKEPRFSSLPIIMLTAKSLELNDDVLGTLHISHLLPKPFSPRELCQLVEHCLACDELSRVENHLVPAK